MLRWCTDAYHEVHVHPSKSGGWAPQKAFPVSHIYPFVEILHGHPHAPRENPCTAGESVTSGASVHHRRIRAPPLGIRAPRGDRAPCVHPLGIRAINRCMDTSPVAPWPRGPGVRLGKDHTPLADPAKSSPRKVTLSYPQTLTPRGPQWPTGSGDSPHPQNGPTTLAQESWAKTRSAIFGDSHWGSEPSKCSRKFGIFPSSAHSPAHPHPHTSAHLHIQPHPTTRDHTQPDTQDLHPPRG
jgi:hypothetical protein